MRLPVTDDDSRRGDDPLRQWWLRAVRSGFGYAQACHRTYGRGEDPPLYWRELRARRVLGRAFCRCSRVALALTWHPLLLLVWPRLAGAAVPADGARDGADAAALATSASTPTGRRAALLSRASRGSAGGTIVYK
jgi:hypothetical protein